MVTIAKIHDTKEVNLMMRVSKELCSWAKVILTGEGYRGVLDKNSRNEFGFVIQIVGVSTSMDLGLSIKDGL